MRRFVHIRHPNTIIHQFKGLHIYLAFSHSFKFKQGKVGPDGKDLLPHESPKVNGYGFEGEPSPAPGESEEPRLFLFVYSFFG